MKKVIIIAALFMLAASTVAAEPRIFLSQLTCNSDTQLPFDIVKEKHGEEGVAMGKAVIQDARTKTIHTIDLVITLNIESRKFTLIGIFADGTGCIIASGKDFQRFQPKEKESI
jgi:hypothetical protein|tara:strand:+ start:498 stop:839 length:342 start_codon:yes stop_codon:yes gene_type:complete